MMPPASTSLESILTRDRFSLLAAIVLSTALAWAYMIYEARGMMRTGICQCMGLQMAGPDVRSWSVPQVLALFLMWSEMMFAMMLPSAAPIILTFAAVNRKRCERAQPFVSTGVFVAGYLVIWFVFSAAATLAQWALHSAALLSPMMVATSPWLGGALLIAAGIFQWTPWKNACLTQCANPLSFLLTQWREGKRGALIMGLHHGAFCLGCCWLLMLLLFVLGVMNVAWIATLTIYVLLEKVLGRHRWFAHAAGIALCAWGAIVLARGI